MSAVLQSPATKTGSRWEKYRAAIGGLSEYWYPLTTAAELMRKKRQMVTCLGKNLVLFYEQNRFYALLDKCPHRGVPLSMGSLEFPGHLSCIYHGWTFELKSGEMIAALTDGPGSPATGKARVRTFPVEERAGLRGLVHDDLILRAPPHLQRLAGQRVREQQVRRVRVQHVGEEVHFQRVA